MHIIVAFLLGALPIFLFWSIPIVIGKILIKIMKGTSQSDKIDWDNTLANAWALGMFALFVAAVISGVIYMIYGIGTIMIDSYHTYLTIHGR